MYQDFFGLAVKPFELVPNPIFLYHSRSHRKAINYLKYGLREGAGFILLTGEVGSGKTTILRDIIADLDKDVVLAMLFNTRVSTKQVLAMINEEFGLEVAGRDKVALLRDLNDFLVDMHGRNKRPVVIVDEAQNLSTAALEEIRLLSNLESNDAKLLQIVLVGQPELKQTITRHELRQLRQRISVHCHIDPLSRQETEDYVYHRLELAGNRSAATWEPGTFDVLYQYSHGIPRLINIFCDFILLAACADGTTTLSLPLVEEVLGDTSWDHEIREARELELRQGSSGAGCDRADDAGEIVDLTELLGVREELENRFREIEGTLQGVQTEQQSALEQIQGSLARLQGELSRLRDELGEKTRQGDGAPVMDQVAGAPRKGLLRKLFSL